MSVQGGGSYAGAVGGKEKGTLVRHITSLILKQAVLVFVIVSREFSNDQLASSFATATATGSASFFFNEVQLLFLAPKTPTPPHRFDLQLQPSDKCRAYPFPQAVTNAGGVRDPGYGRRSIHGRFDSVAFSALWHVHDSFLLFAFCGPAFCL